MNSQIFIALQRKPFRDPAFIEVSLNKLCIRNKLLQAHCAINIQPENSIQLQWNHPSIERGENSTKPLIIDLHFEKSKVGRRTLQGKNLLLAKHHFSTDVIDWVSVSVKNFGIWFNVCVFKFLCRRIFSRRKLTRFFN